MATGGVAGALRRFELDGVYDTGREVGYGSFAVVKELEYRGLKCVGKKIHDILLDSATPHEKAALLERFAGECELLGGLRHPCIVQFLGVWFEQGSRLPILVMEYLHTTLSACLEKYGVLPKEISYGILRDVALGLRYLHERSPPIIHRDLSANNVLLTSNMNAKLSDLGVAKILNLTPARMTQMTQTKAPGTPCYMPPEALAAKPKYTSKIDVYSYGVLIIHTLCGEWPFPEGVFRPDPQNPDKMIPISEVERRTEYLQKIGDNHPLMAMIHQCLSNVPAQRPDAQTVLNQVNTILSALPQPFTNRLKMLQQLQSMVHQFEARIQTLTDTYQSEIDSLTQSKQSEIEFLRAEVERLSVRSPSQQTPRKSSLPGEPNMQNQPELLHPQVKLQWKRCADMPVKMSRMQVVVMGEKVYMGGGHTEDGKDAYWVFQYNSSQDEWSYLPSHSAFFFAMAQFSEILITVGGVMQDGVTGKVYRFKERSHKWEEFLEPMPTARFCLSLATTKAAIVASGGDIDVKDGKPVPCATVEVYSSETSQWHTADPLAVPCGAMTSVTIADTWYLLGGDGTGDEDVTTVQYTPLTTLLQKAKPSSRKSTSRMSVWKTLPDTPLKSSAAASLSGNLLAIGGYSDKASSSPSVHIFLPLTNSWVRATTGNLPQPCHACTAVQLSSNRVLVVGGKDSQDKHTKTVFLGSRADFYVF